MTFRKALLSSALMAAVVVFVCRDSATRQVRADVEGVGLYHAGLGQSIAGTYFTTVDAVGFPQFFDVLTLHADGTLVTTAEDDFGFGDIGVNGFNSPEHGVWKRSGPRQIDITTVFFTYDGNGRLESFVRVRGVIRFSEDFVNLEADLSLDVFGSDQSPLHETPLLTLPGIGSGERIVVQ